MSIPSKKELYFYKIKIRFNRNLEINSLEEFKKAVAESGLKCVLINTAAGDSAGLGALPGRSVDFLKTVKEAIKYATAVDCPMIHLMAGKVPEGKTKVERAKSFFP